MSAAPPPSQPDLTKATERVMAFVAGSAISHRPLAAHAAAPIRALPPALQAKLAARAEAGLDPVGAKHPRSAVWYRVVAPSGALAVADATATAAGAAAGHTALAVAAGALFVPLAAVAALGARFAARDPLRLSGADRRAIRTASTWQSSNDWSGPVAGTYERGLVFAAARAAEQIARSTAWQSGRWDDQRLRLDVGAELDQIDAQAHRLALARRQHGPTPTPLGTVPVIDAAWTATLNRVAALTEYGDQLTGYEQRRAAALGRRGDPVRDSDLLTGVTQDEMSLEQIAALTSYLTRSLDDPLA